MAVAIPTGNTATSGNVFTKPSGLADGDVLYIRYHWFDPDLTTGTPSCSGFTAVAVSNVLQLAGNYRFGVVILRKVITNAAGEPSTYTVSRLGSPDFDGGRIDRATGGDTSTPETDTGSAYSGSHASTTAWSTGAAVDSGADDLTLIASITFGDFGVGNVGTPAGMNQDYEIDGGDCEGWSQALGAVSGATKSATIDNAGDWTTVWVTIKASTGGGGSTVTADVTSQAAVSVTATKDIASAASLVTTNTKDVTSQAALTTTNTKDVSTAASLTAGNFKDVTTAAVVSTPDFKDVSTAAAISTTNTKDVATAAALVTGGSKDVSTQAALTTTNTKDVASQAAITTTNTKSVSTQAAISLESLVFDEEFDGDFSKWYQLDRAGDAANSELQYHRPANNVINAGIYELQSKHETFSGFDYTSGGIFTDPYSFVYGRVESRIKIPSARGVWPLLWTLGVGWLQAWKADADTYDDGSKLSEIDIMEFLSHDFTQINTQLHLWSESGDPGGLHALGFDASGDYHLYELDKQPTYISFKVDGIEVENLADSYINYASFIILETAIGGAGGSATAGDYPATQYVDYVRVWAIVAAKNVTTQAAISTPNTKDVATAAALTTTNTKDVATAASISAGGAAQDVATQAAVSCIVSVSVSTQAAIATTNTKDVSSAAALVTTNTKDVSTAAAISVAPGLSVGTAASVSCSVSVSVSTAAAISTSATKDVATQAAVSRIATKDVSTAAAMSANPGVSVTTQAAVSAVAGISVTTAASISSAGAAVIVRHIGLEGRKASQGMEGRKQTAVLQGRIS